jgi:arginyl-tRNA synthetase
VDWGTQFGMLIRVSLKSTGTSADEHIEDLEDFLTGQAKTAAFDADPSFQDDIAADRRVFFFAGCKAVRSEERAAWQKIVDEDGAGTTKPV